MESLPLSKVYRLIEPGPVLMLTTKSPTGINIMTLSYHMMVDDSTPLIGCSIGPWDASFMPLQETGECVICVPAVNLMEKTIRVGNCTGKDVDKFMEFGLTTLPASKVKAPLVGECLANFECVISDRSLVDEYNLFIFQVIAAWINPNIKDRRLFHHNGDGTFTEDGRVMNYKDLMTRWPDYIA